MTVRVINDTLIQCTRLLSGLRRINDKRELFSITMRNPIWRSLEVRRGNGEAVVSSGGVDSVAVWGNRERVDGPGVVFDAETLQERCKKSLLIGLALSSNGK